MHLLRKALVVNVALRDCGCEELLLLHPPCSLDLALCDFHPCLSLKGHICAKHFEVDNELNTATEEWLLGQDKTLYLSGLEKLCEHYNKYIPVYGRKEGNVLFNDALQHILFTVIWCQPYGKGPLR